MAENFKECIEILSEEIHDPASDDLLARYLVRALRHFRGKRFSFSEKSAEMDLTVDVWEYGVEQGLPGDLLAIDGVPVLRRGTGGTQWFPFRPQITMGEMRHLHLHGNMTGYPEDWTWYGRKLFVHPIPSITYPIVFDYHADFTRDEETGVVLDADCITATNDFIREGEEALIGRAAAFYYAGPQGDPEAAALWEQIWTRAEQDLFRERDLQKFGGGAQVAAYL